MVARRPWQGWSRRTWLVLAVIAVVALGASGVLAGALFGHLKPSSSPRPVASAPRSNGSPVTSATGGIVEYQIPTPPGCGDNCNQAVGTIALGPDGNMWFVDVGAQALGRVTPDGEVTQFRMPVELAGGSQSIIKGGDNYIWVLGRAKAPSETDWVLRVAPDGRFTKYPTASINAGTESIAAGPDGNVWFTEFWAGRIARMTTSGVVTEFPTLAPDSHPRGIVAGPDGNLWFVEEHPPAIGRITPAGVVTEFPVEPRQTDSPPKDVIVGPDGNLWFTRWLGDGLGRISPSGRVTSVALPQGSTTTKLAAGPDGNIWFTDSGNNAIGRMNVAGAVREFALPRPNSQPFGIAVGVDGRIWFGERDRIGSIGLKVPEALFSTHVLIFADSSPKTVTVTNTGDAALTLAKVKVSGADSNVFGISGDTCSGKTLNSGAKCEVTAGRAPSASSEVQAATLEFPDNATGSPQKISLVAQLRACKLPIVVSLANEPPQGSVLDTTTGTTRYEPRGGFTTTPATPSRVQTVAQPMLTGVTSGYYDGPAGRWLPVSDSNWISPDGSRYVFVDIHSGFERDLHVVDVSTGRDRVLQIGPGSWTVVAFTAQGVYLNQQYEGIRPGLRLMNPDTGSMRQVLDDSAVYVTGNTAWIGLRNPTDTQPQWGMGGGYNEIDSRDLVSGATEAWLYVPGSQIHVRHVYNGMPVVIVAKMSGSQLLIVTSPNQAKSVVLPFTSDPSQAASGFVSDSQGLWIGTPDGIYLWTLRTGGILVSSEPATPAGTCL